MDKWVKACRWGGHVYRSHPDLVNEFLDRYQIRDLGVDYSEPLNKLFELRSVQTAQGVVNFPGNMKAPSGSAWLFNVLSASRKWLESIPLQCYGLLEITQLKFEHQNPLTSQNIKRVAESVLIRGAMENGLTVQMAQRSFQTMIRSIYGANIAPRSIKTALKYMEDSEYFKILDWGRRGDFENYTTILIQPLHTKLIDAQGMDTWLREIGPVVDLLHEDESERHDKRVADVAKYLESRNQRFLAYIEENSYKLNGQTKVRIHDGGL